MLTRLDRFISQLQDAVGRLDEMAHSGYQDQHLRDLILRVGSQTKIFSQKPPFSHACQHELRQRSCRTPGRSRRSELRSYVAASFIHLLRGEASVLFFPPGDGRQTSAPLQRLARRAGHPG